MNTITELSDEQIESMRLAIRGDVDRRSRAKTRRYRQVVAGTAVVIAVGSLGATAIQSIDAPTLSAGAGDSSADSAPEFSGESAEKGAADSDATAPDRAAAPGDATGGKTEGQTDREIVTTGSIGMTVTKPVDTAARISTYVSSAGGRVDSRSETASTDDDGGSVRLVVRLPQDKVEDSITTFRTYGTIDSVNIQDYDATAEGKDLDARIKALGVSVDRLSALMAKATSTNELLRAETALTQRQSELDSLVSQRKSLSDRVALSSIEIDLAAKSSAASPSASGFWGGVVDGWNALVSTFEGLVHGFGVILPWLVVILVLGGLGWLVTRRRRTA